jgi:cytidyltransferase-like protein
MKIIAITSGYFNPIHPGHIECFRMAKELPGVNELCVIVNNDLQARLKRGVDSFQAQEDRLKIVASIKWVDKTFLSIDTDSTVCQSIKHITTQYKTLYPDCSFVFAKGGDRFASNTPEYKVCQELGIKLIDGLGQKTHNSSEYVKKRLDIDEKLKEEISEYLKNVDFAMKAYDFSLHSKQYVDIQSHENHINKIKQLTIKLKEKVK